VKKGGEGGESETRLLFNKLSDEKKTESEKKETGKG